MHKSRTQQRRGCHTLALIGALLLHGCTFNLNLNRPASDSTPVVREDHSRNDGVAGTSTAVPSSPQASGRVTVRYQPGKTADTRREEQLMKQDRLLEDFAEVINETFALPQDLTVLGTDCDESNAFYDSSNRTITVCYELATTERALLVEAGYEDDDEIATLLNQSTVGTLYHELGHALIDVLALPFTGREEDVADQLSAYVLTQDQATSHYLLTIANLYEQLAVQVTEVEELTFADTHSLDAQRAVNFHCYAYGSDPRAYAYLVSEQRLDQSRAEGCEAEFEQMRGGWDALLAPHFKEAS
ncbi:DUF4344 domain-containing metallopeptidase [Pseudomonas sp. MWU13-3659]|uniref:DUF4344 domain-containing metallopeptidase n=1 Tax=Pseudomonas sp. MWU13-3659 TaxID=2986964 RepID=UPI0020750619|nr:DUF4344 domain-containing metallopeptidase [Pseudomonas sp. MWU13-3659]